MRFVLIPAGTFMMGSRDTAAEVAKKCNMSNAQAGWFTDEFPRHKVTLTKAFYMSIHEVTLGNNVALNPPPKPKKDKKKDKKKVEKPAEPKDPNLPMSGIAIGNAENFCKKLSGKEKRTYLIPTEAQWEYACRAGKDTPFGFGETVSPDQANYHGEYTYGEGKKGENRGKPIPVGSLAANAWGLYDMHGNLSEWVSSRYALYGSEPVTDPKGPEKGNERVLRGGSFRSYPGACRASFRLKRGGGGPDVGFRISCELPTKDADKDKKKGK